MMEARAIAVAAGCLIAVSAAPATASMAGESNGAIRPLLNCRQIAPAADRLACFDRESAALDAADRKQEITVLDKAAVHATRRSLFGFAMPNLPFLGGDRTDGAEKNSGRLDVIQATIASARSLGYGKWRIELDDGAQWVTTEAIAGRQPGAGKTIEIKRGAIGSYMGKIDGGRAVRMTRVN